MLLLLFQLWDTAKPPPSSITNTHSFLSLVHLKTSSNIQREQQTMHASAGKRHYKLCALTAIVLIALWSMFTGTVTLKWSTNNVNQFSDGLDSMILEDLDVLVWYPTTRNFTLIHSYRYSSFLHKSQTNVVFCFCFGFSIEK